jgi:hypothetical protein
LSLKAKGECSDLVHSDQIVLVMVRQEAGPHEKQPKTLKRELENNSRKLRDLVRKLAKKNQPTLSLDKKKKGDVDDVMMKMMMQ